MNFNPETSCVFPELVRFFYAYCYIHDNFFPIIKVGTEKLQTPLFEMKAGFLCSPDQRAIRLPSDFVPSFFFSDIVVV
jgi:hypothetical protein